MIVELSVEPEVEPVSLSEMKAHLRVDSTVDDAYITSLITSARRHCEEYAWRSFCTQTWTMTLDAFPSGVIELPRGRVQSVVVQYYDEDGELQTLDAEEYVTSFSDARSRIAPISGGSWPETEDRIGAVLIEVTGGYGDASDVPEPIKSAIKLHAGHLYANREDVVTGTIATKLPVGVERILDPYRLFRFE